MTAFAKVSLLALLLTTALVGAAIAVNLEAASDNAKVFDVRSYGAKADGKTDNSEAFLRAWKDGCEWNGKARILVPAGNYMCDTVMFLGPCKGSMAFILEGLLIAPDKLEVADKWITFRYLTGFFVSGGGTFDARGYTAPTPKPRAISVRFEFITDGTISHVRSLDSRNVHMELFGCNRMFLHHLKITAPADSHNTDGIKIGRSTNVKIQNTIIGTGDDCIAILGESHNLDISQVYCGPGHGISIGSMGYFADSKNDIVTGVTVTDCTFNGTSDGVRIKTWARPNPGLASNITYRNIGMVGVQNPINIDQHYCPTPPCDQSTPSHVQIQDVTYDNIWGTTSSEVAVKLNCSNKFDCKGVVLKDINIVQLNGQSASASCSNVLATAFGLRKPACV